MADKLSPEPGSSTAPKENVPSTVESSACEHCPQSFNAPTKLAAFTLKTAHYEQAHQKRTR